MSAIDDKVTARVQAAFPEAIEEIVDFRGERTLLVDMAQVKPICQLLRDDPELKYELLEDVVADDYYPEFPRFAMSYHMFSLKTNHRLRLRCWVEDPDDGPETLAEIWPIATWPSTAVAKSIAAPSMPSSSVRWRVH